MTLDPITAGIFTAIAVVTIAVTYIATTLSRRYSGGAQLWGIGFLLQIIAVVCTVVIGLFDASEWTSVWALALGNAAAVGAAGCVLMGFRAYNGEEVAGPSLMVVSLAFLVAAVTVVERPGAGGSTSVLWYSLAIAGLCVGAIIHAVGPRTRPRVATWVFVGSTTLFGAYHVMRAVVTLTAGGDSSVFAAWFGPVSLTLVVLVLGTVSSLTLFMLRAVLVSDQQATGFAAVDEVLAASAFLAMLRRILRRAAHRTELVVVIAVIVEDVGAITASFGQEVAEATTRVLRSAVREFASPVAAVGATDDRTIILVATTASSPSDARRQAGLIYRGVIERFVDARGIVVPGVGVGVALSQTLGYGPEVLVEAATIAAVEASESDETSVVFAQARGVGAPAFPGEPTER